MAAEDFLSTMQCNFRTRSDDAEPSQMEAGGVMADSITGVYNWTSRLSCRGRCRSECMHRCTLFFVVVILATLEFHLTARWMMVFSHFSSSRLL